jgi:Spy/CpxP family protein refolding chaperone|tara:strand:+ start:338 stop:1213 length:876 start_codon:yes stop_codon:yes gene_type:complete
MRTLKSLFTPIAVSIAIILAQPSASAKPPEHKAQISLRHFLKQVDLTDSQRQDVRLLMQQNRATKDTYQPDQESTREVVRNLIQTDEWHETDISSALEAELHLQAQLMWLNIQTQHQIWLTLNEAQKAQILTELNITSEEAYIENALDENAHNELKQQNEEHRQGKHEMHQEQRQKKLIAALNLSDEQQALLVSQRAAEKADREAHKPAHQTLKAEFIGLITAENLGEPDWIALQAQTQTSQFEHAFTRAKNQYTFWNSLSSEQQHTLQEIITKQQREQKRRPRFGRKDES